MCEGCVLGKHARHSFPSEKPSQASTPLELVHVNLCGQMQIKSLGGRLYLLLVTNDWTKYSCLYFIKYKSQTFEKFKTFKVMTEKQLKILCTSRGSEFLLVELKDHCEEQGI